MSGKKGDAHRGKPILEASFRDFRWISDDGREVPAKNTKMIIYPQYPEARLSGFDPVEGHMPPSMSVQFTKANPDAVRFLLLARRGTGDALGMMICQPSDQFVEEVKALPGASKSRVWKQLDLGVDASAELKALLSDVASRVHDGCRLDREHNILPFNGTQVCGFTLEQALGIVPNSDKNGDFKGIELKTHTQKKLTLFTPEPDLGPYRDDFNNFMRTYGYDDGKGSFRLTGIHRVGVKCAKSGLTLRIDQYDPTKSLASQTNKEIVVGLYTDDGTLAAGWSLPRMLNCWGAKHNEVVYIPAAKAANMDQAKVEADFKYTVTFSEQVLWCKRSSADRLLQAIMKGTVFLDPAPKYVPDDPKSTKRRSQWRINDIRSAAADLYEHAETVRL